MAMAATLLIGLGLGATWSALTRRARPEAGSAIVREVLDSHIRSLAGGATHLMDVASTDQHTVKPWFQGKLDFSPAVTDLAPQGFPLLGGRVDYIDGHPAAALVYGRRQHLINLYQWPAAEGATGADIASELHRGYTVLHWVTGGLECWAVSDVNASDLREFARNIILTQR